MFTACWKTVVDKRREKCSRSKGKTQRFVDVNSYILCIYTRSRIFHLFTSTKLQHSPNIPQPCIGARSLPPVTLVVHGSSDLGETGNVGTSNQGWELALGWDNVLLGGVKAVLEAVLHDALELLVNLLGGPL